LVQVIECSNNNVSEYCVFISADKTLVVEDVRQFDTYEDGMICHHVELSLVGHVNGIILAFVAASGSLGSASSSCGLSTDCSPEEFSVHLFSGKENIDGPKIW